MPELLEFDASLTRYTFWREHVLFLDTMRSFVKYFSVPQLIEEYSPKIYDQLKYAIDPKKQPLCQLLCEMIHLNFRLDDR